MLSEASRVKVVQVVGRLVVGGPTGHVLCLHTKLDPLRYCSLIVCGAPNKDEYSVAESLAGQGVQPIVIREMVSEANLKMRDVVALVKLYSIFRREHPDIVHTHTAKAGVLGRLAARLARVPVVVHTYHGHILHGYFGTWRTTGLRVMERCLARLSDKLIAVGEEVRRELLKYRVDSGAKIAVVPLGLDLAPFRGSGSQKGLFREELGLDPGQMIVGAVGRLVPIKNHRLFLEAASQIAAREPRSRFVIVGDGVLRADLEEYAERLRISNKVYFTGWRMDLPRVYADLDVLVVSSENEGTPVCVIEAMAAGCPVVATAVGGLPDLISHGETGYLVRCGDAGELTAAVLSVLTGRDHSRVIAERARTKTERDFSTARLIADLDALYGGLLQGYRLRTKRDDRSERHEAAVRSAKARNKSGPI